jgi:hypothetical protein
MAVFFTVAPAGLVSRLRIPGAVELSQRRCYLIFLLLYEEGFHWVIVIVVSYKGSQLKLFWQWWSLNGGL